MTKSSDFLIERYIQFSLSANESELLCGLEEVPPQCINHMARCLEILLLRLSQSLRISTKLDAPVYAKCNAEI